MSQSFVKGRTNNHLTWVMVDATDFATPESALSAATKIKIYGKLRGAAGVNFVSSGTGSLTNDITHVGASALGIYSIGLAKADLSDASAAWYDQYIISLSATGAAYQTLIVDGGIDASALSAMQSRLSDIQSYLAVMSGVQSDLYSAMLLTQSLASDAHSAAILGASHASDAYSAILLTQSLASDAHSAATLGASRALVIQSRLSDFDSRLVSDVSDLMSMHTAMSALLSDTHSAATLAASRALVTQSLASDTYSAVLLTQSLASDAHSAAAQANSRALVIQSLASDAHSMATLAASAASDAHSAASDLRSALLSALIDERNSTASATGNASTLEIAGPIDHDDALNGHWIKLLSGSQADELRLIVDTDKTTSRITVKPAFLSAVASGVDYVILGMGSPYLSQVHSDVRSYLGGLSGLESDIYSAVLLTQSLASDAHSAATLAASRALVIQSTASDIYSLVSDLSSDLTVMSGVLSDAYSAVLLTQSLASEAQSAATLAASRALVTQSHASDIYSLLSDVGSDLHVLSGAVDTLDNYVDTEVAAIKAKTDNLPEGVTKNAILANFMFFMVDSTDHVTGKTGLTVTAERSLDGAAFGACANAVAEVANGVYKITLAAADTNADFVVYKFTAAGADATVIAVKTEA